MSFQVNRRYTERDEGQFDESHVRYLNRKKERTRRKEEREQRRLARRSKSHKCNKCCQKYKQKEQTDNQNNCNNDNNNNNSTVFVTATYSGRNSETDRLNQLNHAQRQNPHHHHHDIHNKVDQPVVAFGRFYNNNGCVIQPRQSFPLTLPGENQHIQLSSCGNFIVLPQPGKYWVQFDVAADQDSRGHLVGITINECLVKDSVTYSHGFGFHGTTFLEAEYPNSRISLKNISLNELNNGPFNNSAIRLHELPKRAPNVSISVTLLLDHSNQFVHVQK